jgi:hypothetical protein
MPRTSNLARNYRMVNSLPDAHDFQPESEETQSSARYHKDRYPRPQLGVRRKRNMKLMPTLICFPPETLKDGSPSLLEKCMPSIVK